MLAQGHDPSSWRPAPGSRIERMMSLDSVKNQFVRAATGKSSSATSFARIWRALRHRNFRLFFTGQSISLIGTWMTRIATAWLVYELTKSSLLLGLVGFAGQIPTFLLAPFAGVWVDRLDRQRVLVVTQVLAMLQSLALAVLTLSGRITIHQILWLSAFQGAINAFDM
ncbi:MAG TPA: MFS transporter, partial [Bryobacteraceae bacterium]|nr:MFS transporter [Bryobacteraceae bacterium]